MNELQTLKNNVDILSYIERYTTLKKLSDTKYKATTNPLRSEKTSSLVVYVDTQKVHDFGSSKSYDILDLIQILENKTKKEAIEILKSKAISIEYAPPPLIPKFKEFDYLKVIKEIEANFNKYTLIDFANSNHYKAFFDFIDFDTFQKAKEANRDFILRQVKINNFNKLVIAYYRFMDYKFQNVGYAIRNTLAKDIQAFGKYCYCKDSQHTKGCLVRIIDDDKYILVVEGIRDFYNAVLLDLNVIAVPNCGYKSFNEYEIELLRNRDMKFFIEDDKALANMNILATQIQGIAKDVKLISYYKANQKLDFTDYIKNKNKGA